MDEEKVVTVYVRKGGRDHERRFSFERIPQIEDNAELFWGIAIDGNQAMFELTTDDDGEYRGPFLLDLEAMKKVARGQAIGAREPVTSMAEAIALVELHLVEWFKEIDYAVEFA